MGLAASATAAAGTAALFAWRQPAAGMYPYSCRKEGVSHSQDAGGRSLREFIPPPGGAWGPKNK